MMNSHIHLIKYDTDLNQVNNPVQLTFESDVLPGKHITDHKQLYLNNEIFITYSLSESVDLFLFKIDNLGNRIGGLVSVIENSPNPTNDMILTSDSNSLYLLHYLPPLQHLVYTYDQNLNQIGDVVVTSSSLPHNNMGGAVFTNGKFSLFTGDLFGYNSSVILTKWDVNWSPLIDSAIVIIPTNNGNGNYFSSGCVYDEYNHRWYIGFHHFESSTTPDGSHIDLVVLNEDMIVLERYHESISFRPHFLLHNNYLYMIYDKAGVFIKKYIITNNSFEEDLNLDGERIFKGIIPEEYSIHSIYPNPFNPITSITYGLPENTDVHISVYNITGTCLTSLVNGFKTPGYHTINWNANNQASGVYFVKMTAGEYISTQKLMLIK